MLVRDIWNCSEMKTNSVGGFVDFVNPESFLYSLSFPLSLGVTQQQSFPSPPIYACISLHTDIRLSLLFSVPPFSGSLLCVGLRIEWNINNQRQQDEKRTLHPFLSFPPFPAANQRGEEVWLDNRRKESRQTR
jgi:hypothetical protein